MSEIPPMAGSSNQVAMAVVRQYDIAPWGAAPTMQSRLRGLGGTEPAREPACVFETALLIFEPGQVTVSIEIVGFSGSVAIMFIDLTNSSVIEGSPNTRLQLKPVELHSDRGHVQRYEIDFTAYSHIAYRLGGYIHGDSLLQADGLVIKSNRPFTHHRHSASSSPSQMRPRKCGLVRRDTKETARLYDLTVPDFERIHSQPITPQQLSHPAFLRLQADLFNNNKGAAWRQWPEIFAARAMEIFGVENPAQGIGFDVAEGELWKVLLENGHSITLSERTFDPAACIDLGEARKKLMTRSSAALMADALFHYSLIGEALPPGYCKKFDFAWWIVEAADDWRSVVRGILNVADSLNEKAVGVAVFPIHFGDTSLPGAISAKLDLPRILIDILSLGHKIVQVRLPAMTETMHDPVHFGLILKGDATERSEAI